MKRFERIKIYNKKYTNELANDLKLIKPKIIKAFVNIYGEKQRDYITYTLNKIRLLISLLSFFFLSI